MLGVFLVEYQPCISEALWRCGHKDLLVFISKVRSLGWNYPAPFPQLYSAEERNQHSSFLKSALRQQGGSHLEGNLGQMSLYCEEVGMLRGGESPEGPA